MKKRSAMAVAGAVALSLLAGMVSREVTQTSSEVRRPGDRSHRTRVRRPGARSHGGGPRWMTGRRVPRKRASRRALEAWAWAAAGVSFVLPWAAFSAAPRPAALGPSGGRVPTGWRVVSVSGSPGTGGAVKVVAPGGKAAGSTTAPVATTGGSAPPP